MATDLASKTSVTNYLTIVLYRCQNVFLPIGSTFYKFHCFTLNTGEPFWAFLTSKEFKITLVKRRQSVDSQMFIFGSISYSMLFEFHYLKILPGTETIIVGSPYQALSCPHERKN